MSKFTLEKTFPIQLLIYSQEGKSILIQNVDLTFDMLTSVSAVDEDSIMNAQIKQNVSFGKAMGWIEGILNQSLMFEGNELDFYDLNNNFVLLPDLTENTVCAAIHCKLNSIIEEDSYITKVTMYDKDDKVKYSYTADADDDYPLPTLKEWLGDKTYWDIPWWYREDVTTYDKVAKTQEEYSDWIKQKTELNIDKKNMQMFNDIESEVENVFKSVMLELAGKEIEEEKAVPKEGKVINLFDKPTNK